MLLIRYFRNEQWKKSIVEYCLIDNDFPSLGSLLTWSQHLLLIQSPSQECRNSFLILHLDGRNPFTWTIITASQESALTGSWSKSVHQVSNPGIPTWGTYSLIPALTAGQIPVLCLLGMWYLLAFNFFLNSQCQTKIYKLLLKTIT